MNRIVRICLLAAPLVFEFSCTGGPRDGDGPKGRVIILGFDGVDPRIAQTMMDAGDLPNLSALRSKGGFQALESTIPPQSPAAWTSFATCRNPGAHGIYDFIRRDARSYVAMPGTGVTVQPEFWPDGELKRAPKSVAFRQGKVFWKVADDQGRRCKLIHVPFAYPPDELTQSLMLCGAGVPEIGGSMTYFYALSDAFTDEQLAESIGGGVRIPLAFEGGKAAATIPGPMDPGDVSQSGRIGVEISISVDRAGNAVTIDVPGRQISLAAGAWSDWIEWDLPVTEQYRVRAISIFYLLEAGEHVRLYMSSLQFHPEKPFISMSAPETFAPELAERYGLYKTLGWSHDTTALRRDALDEDAFLEEARVHDEWVKNLTLDELDRGGFDMLVSVWTAPDRISHVFWRFRDPDHPLYTEEGARKYGRAVEDSYIRMDGIVGEVMKRLGPEDLLMVISDHGFHSWRKGFSVNTWLVRHGYMVLEGQTDAQTARTATEDDALRSVDWSRTKAYSIGLGAIYLNIRGREGDGIVEPGDAASLANEIRKGLEGVTDPENGDSVFNAIYGRDVFVGPSDRDAPDLQLGYADGYQTSKASAKGAVPPEIFEPNTDKWSGEHASSDRESTPGILFSNRNLENPAGIVDIGVTALKYLDVDVPNEYEGENRLP